MTDVKVRRLEDWVVQVWRRRAEVAGRSLEEELRQVLTDEALRPQVEFAERAAALRAKIRRSSGVLTDSTEHVRADRAARG